MKHRPCAEEQDNLLLLRLIGMVDPQHELVKLAALIDPSSLTSWRGRIGEEGVEWMLTPMIRAGQKSGTINEDSARRVAVDTTVMEKAVAYRN